jgi:hypothetical protein
MNRDYLLEEMRHATNPNDVSSAIFDAREYLSDHPEDKRVWSALEDLIEIEQEYWA